MHINIVNSFYLPNLLAELYVWFGVPMVNIQQNLYDGQTISKPSSWYAQIIPENVEYNKWEACIKTIAIQIILYEFFGLW